MASMTDKQILEIARAAVPAHIRPLGRIVERDAEPTPATVALARLGPEKPSQAKLIAELARKVGATVPKAKGRTAEVEFPEQTALGLRTTVVHVKDGKVQRVLKRG